MLDGDYIVIELSGEVGIVLGIGRCEFFAEHGGVGTPVRLFQIGAELVDSLGGIDEW